MAPPITFWGDCRNAIEAAGKALSLLSLSSPRGYFLETIASLACFLELNHDPRHDEQALVILGHFSKRLKGLRRWQEVCDRMHWVEGQLHARLGHPRRARKRLERARKAHVKRSPHHWALAIGIDEALHYSRHAGRPELHFHSIRRVITTCANELELDAELSGRLAELSQLLKEEPYHADRFISQFRRSFMTPVAGLLVDLTKPGVLDRKWPYGPDIATARRQRLPWGMANLSNG